MTTRRTTFKKNQTKWEFQENDFLDGGVKVRGFKIKLYHVQAISNSNKQK